MWTSAQSLLYSFSLAFDNISNVLTKGRSKVSPKIWVAIGSILAFALSVAMTLFGLTPAFNAFLLTIGIAIPSIGGILIAHYFIVLRGNFALAFENVPTIRPVAFAAWIIGIVVAKNLAMGIPALNGLLAAFICYSVLGLATVRRS
jgi:cytosine permease